MNAREEIMPPPSRLDDLASLSRAVEVAASQSNMVAGSGMGSGQQSMFEVVTAQRVVVPRDLAAFIQRVKTLAAVAGENYYYSFPVRSKNKATGQWVDAPPIEGPSISLAQDLAREYGNCAVDTRVFDVGDRWVIYARFTDYERGFSQVRPYLQRKGQESIGGKDRGRQEDAAFQIGVSKAIRNVVVKSLDTFADMMFEEARSGLTKAVAAKLDFYKGRIKDRLKQLGVELHRVEPFLGKPIDAWGAQETTRVVAELKSIAEGMATAAELWPSIEKIIDPTAKETQGDEPEDNKKPGGAQAKIADGDATPGADGNGAAGTHEAGGATGNDAGDAQGGQSGQAEPEPEEKEVSEKLGLAYIELGKLRTIAQINDLDAMCLAQMTEGDYDDFTQAKEQKLKAILDQSKADAKRVKK